MTSNPRQKYSGMIEDLLEGRLTATEFETQYLLSFKQEPESLRDDIFLILDRLFGDVDAFCSDASLRGKDDLDEGQLRQRAREALAALHELDGEE